MRIATKDNSRHYVKLFVDIPQAIALRLRKERASRRCTLCYETTCPYGFNAFPMRREEDDTRIFPGRIVSFFRDRGISRRDY